MKSLRREIAADLRLGVRAGQDAAIDLQHHRVADRQRAVRLLRREPTDLRFRFDFELFAAGFRCLETHHAVSMFELLARRQARNEAMREARQRERIGEQAEAPPAPHARERQPIGQCRRRLVFPKDGQRQQPAARTAAALHLDLAEQELAPGFAYVGEVRRYGSIRSTGPSGQTSGA